MKNKIIVSAPGKLMLLGEHAVVYNRPCIVTAVDQRMHLSIEAIDNKEFQLEAPDVEISNYKKSLVDLGKGEISKGAKFVETAVKNFYDKFKLKNGLKIKTFSEFSSQFGFGSSSASTVCAIKALSDLFDLKLTEKEIFDISYKTVLDIQGKGSGFDVAAAVYGGTLYFLTGGKTIELLHTPKLPLIVGYSGIKADTVSLINKVKEKFLTKEDKLEEIYNEIAELAEKAKESIIKFDWETLGNLMNQNQKHLEELGASIEKLDEMIDASLTAGAYGAKLSGAGGGDCMIAVCSEGKRGAVKKAITEVGGKILKVKTNAEGVRIENKI